MTNTKKYLLVFSSFFILGQPAFASDLGDEEFAGRLRNAHYSDIDPKLVQDASNGDTEAQYFLGLTYFTAGSVTGASERAFKWFMAAAMNEHVAAQCQVGLMYYNGFGVAQSVENAFRWLMKAAENGHIDAKNFIKREIKKAPV